MSRCENRAGFARKLAIGDGGGDDAAEGFIDFGGGGRKFDFVFFARRADDERIAFFGERFGGERDFHFSFLRGKKPILLFVGREVAGGESRLPTMTNKRVFRHFKFDAQRRRFEEGRAKRRKIAAMESTARGFGGSPLLRRVFWIECAQSGAAVFVVLLALAFLHVLSRLLPQIAVGAIPEAAFGWLALVGAVRYAPQLLMSSLFLGIVLAVDRARRDNETLAWATLGAGEPRFTREAVWFALPLVFFRRLAVARRLALGGARGRGANRKNSRAKAARCFRSAAFFIISATAASFIFSIPTTAAFSPRAKKTANIK